MAGRLKIRRRPPFPGGKDVDAAASNLAGASVPGAAVDPVADHVTLTKAAIEMAALAKLLHVQKETQQALIDVMA